MSFFFDANETPEQRAIRLRRSQIAEQMPRNIGEGIGSIGDALAYRGMMNRQNAARASMMNPFDAPQQAAAPQPAFPATPQAPAMPVQGGAQQPDFSLSKFLGGIGNGFANIFG